MENFAFDILAHSVFVNLTYVTFELLFVFFFCKGFVELVDGPRNKLVAFLRENSLKGYPILKCLSADGGKTWSEIFKTSMDSGHRPVAGFLADGRVLVTYRYIPSGTQNLFAAFMSRETIEATGRREQRVRIMPLDYDRNPSPDIGYTGWVQFEDGEIYIVNYIKDDADKAFIRGYSFFIFLLFCVCYNSIVNVDNLVIFIECKFVAV